MTLLSLPIKRIHYTSILFISIPLVLSAFTHLWNPVGFPGIHWDEGTYIRRAMQVLEGLGPQEVNAPRFDHPYFGQLFLAGAFRLLGYPNSIDTSTGDIHSIESLYMVPRVLMGLLAVLDTFLIYKISQYRYNRNVALIASILFAVMPLSWLTRRIYLDSIQLPFLLSSIMFAVYPYHKRSNDDPIKGDKENDNEFSKSNNRVKTFTFLGKKNILVTVLSGVFLGIAIFTKIPAFTMIPMVGLLVYMNNRVPNVSSIDPDNKNKKFEKSKASVIPSVRSVWGAIKNRSLLSVGIWFIPVILIPATWPAYSIMTNHFDDWKEGVIWQATQRPHLGIFDSISSNFFIDPILITLGFAGFIFAAIRRDIPLLLWIVPFLIFFTFIEGFVKWFHWIPIIPGLCIAVAKLVAYISERLSRYIKVQQIVIGAAVGFCIYGLVSTGILVNTNFTSSELNAAAFAANQLIQYKKAHPDYKSNHDITIISGNGVSWIFKYLFGQDNTPASFRSGKPPLKTQHVILMIDEQFSKYLSQSAANQTKTFKKLQGVYSHSHKIAGFDDADKKEETKKNVKSQQRNFNIKVFPYNKLIPSSAGTNITITTNY